MGINTVLPPVWRGKRRILLAGLVAAGLGQAVAATLASVSIPALLTSPGGRAAHAATMAVAALAVATLRWLERVTAEATGQNYVLEVRHLLIAAALSPGRQANLGITVARTSNDLSAIRNWIVLGIGPLLTGIPLVAGAIVALAAMSPPMGAALAATVSALAAALLLLSRPALERSRALRKKRGRLASHIADTVRAAQTIRAAGGVGRELAAVNKLARGLAQRAVARTWVTGAMRGLAAGTSIVAMVAVGAIAAWQQTDPAVVTTALLLVGIMSTPLAELGAISEYRQAYRAARLVLEPVIARGREALARERPVGSEPPAHGASGLAAGAVHLTGLRDYEGKILSGLVADPGVTVLMVSQDPGRIRAVVDSITGDLEQPDGWIGINGHRLDLYGPKRRRELFGFASAGGILEDGTVARALRYRRPDLEQPCEPLLERLGLTETIGALAKGKRTRLRRGGEPLSLDERARLLVGRGLYGNPPLLLLDRVGSDLSESSRTHVKNTLAGYPGVVLVAAHDPSYWPDATVWDLDSPRHCYAFGDAARQLVSAAASAAVGAAVGAAVVAEPSQVTDSDRMCS